MLIWKSEKSKVILIWNGGYHLEFIIKVSLHFLSLPEKSPQSSSALQVNDSFMHALFLQRNSLGAVQQLSLPENKKTIVNNLSVFSHKIVLLVNFLPQSFGDSSEASEHSLIPLQIAVRETHCPFSQMKELLSHLLQWHEEGSSTDRQRNQNDKWIIAYRYINKIYYYTQFAKNAVLFILTRAWQT